MSESILDPRITLTDLLDLPVFREVCEAFTQAFHLGLRVSSESGQTLIESLEPNGFCEEVARLKDGRRLCAEARDRLLTQPLSGSTVNAATCFCGFKYAAFPLNYQFDFIGRVVLGPYRDGPWSPQRLLESQPQLKKEAKSLSGFAERAPQLDPELFKNAVRFLAKALDAFVFVNAKRLITTRLHLNAVMESRQSALKKLEAEPAAMLLDTENLAKLKGLF